MKSQNPTNSYRQQQAFLEQFISFPFDDNSALIFGRLKAQLELSGIPIGIADLQIASIALANKLILVTHNVREFKRVNDLILEDWEIEEN